MEYLYSIPLFKEEKIERFSESEVVKAIKTKKQTKTVASGHNRTVYKPHKVWDSMDKPQTGSNPSLRRRWGFDVYLSI